LKGSLKKKTPLCGQYQRFERMVDFYQNGFPKNSNRKQWPYDQEEIDKLAEFEQILTSKGLRVIRVAGIFREIDEYANDPSLTPYNRINFFNGFSGKNQNGNLFVVTNHARGFYFLEEYWAQILQKQTNTAKENIHFIGQFDSGVSGIDCDGTGY
jgi:hypothetical protein